MELWFETLIRQLILYSFPAFLTLSSMAFIEQYVQKKLGEKVNPQAFWHGSWMPLLASLMFTRGIIFALPYPNISGLRGALVRFSAHLVLCLLGWLLYTWSLSQQPMSGLPPLHHWWAKVLMYMNLCLLALHLLPLPNQLLGELLLQHQRLNPYEPWVSENSHFFVILISLLAATPIIDMLLGTNIVYPIYEWLASKAT